MAGQNARTHASSAPSFARSARRDGQSTEDEYVRNLMVGRRIEIIRRDVQQTLTAALVPDAPT
jgi:hypothetical protein